MQNQDDVAARLQRVNYRLQSCWTQRARLDEEIVALQKKREFLLSMSGEPGGRTVQAEPLSPFAAQNAGQVEVSTSRFLPQALGQSYRPPQRKVTAEDVLRRAQTGVERLQDATQEVVKATQSIVTALDITKNIINLVSPDGRRQLAQIGQGLVGAFSGVAAPSEMMRVSSAPVGSGQGAPTGQSPPAQSPDILSFLSYVTSPAFFEMLASFMQPRSASDATATTEQAGS